MTDEYEGISLPRRRVLYIPMVLALVYCLRGWAKSELILPGISADALYIPVTSIPYVCLALVILLISQIINTEPLVPIKTSLKKPISYACGLIAVSLFFAAATGRI